MAGGRPTKYNKEIVEKARDYLTSWRSHGDMIPSIEALSEVLELDRSTLYDWKKQESKAEFSNILERILVLQQRELINNGLSGDFNAAITKLALGKHGFSDRVESENENKTSMTIKGLTVEYVDAKDTDT